MLNDYGTLYSTVPFLLFRIITPTILLVPQHARDKEEGVYRGLVDDTRIVRLTYFNVGSLYTQGEGLTLVSGTWITSRTVFDLETVYFPRNHNNTPPNVFRGPIKRRGGSFSTSVAKVVGNLDPTRTERNRLPYGTLTVH